MTKVSTSKQGELNWRDLTRGFFMAIIGAVLGVIYPMIENETLFDADGNILLKWKTILMTTIIAAASYLIKNLGDKSKVVITTNSKAEAESIKQEVLRKVV